jgi:hypothetical protein
LIKKTEKTVIYIKLTSFAAEIGAGKKKSHNFQDEWAVPLRNCPFSKM